MLIHVYGQNVSDVSESSKRVAAIMQRQQDHIITAAELPGRGRRGIIVSVQG